MLNKTLIAALSLALAAGGVAASPDEDERDAYYERRGPLPFEVMDRNDDGVISAEEHAQTRNERQALRAEQGYPMRNAAMAPPFEQIDRDGSGAISREELDAWHAQRMQRMPGPPMQ